MLVWLAAGGLWMAVVLAAARRVASPAPQWTIAMLTGATAAMGASAIVWGRTGDRAVSPGASVLDLPQNWRTDGHLTAVQLRPFRRLTPDELLRKLELNTRIRLPQPAEDGPLFQAALLPAGDYEVLLDSRAQPAGTIELFVGRTWQRMDRLTVTGRPSGLSGLVVRLPVLAHSLVIRGDAEATRTIARLSLRPLLIVPHVDRTTGMAVRATRYGATRVFFLDDGAFMEPAGFWTRGDAEARTVVLRDEPGAVPLRLRAGGVPVSVTLATGEWTASLNLGPGEVRELEVPPGAPSATQWSLTLATRGVFRPGLLDHASKDFRALGAWVEFPR